MTEIKYNTEELEAMTEIHPTDEEDNTEIQYPTEEELEAMYKEFTRRHPEYA